MQRAPEFSLSPAAIRGLAGPAVTGFESKLNELLKIPKSKRTFANTVEAFEYAREELVSKTQVAQFLALVSPDTEVRKASEELRLKMGKYLAGVNAREDIYKAINEFAKKRGSLDQQSSKLLEKRLDDFARNGLHLGERARREVERIQKELVETSLEFQKNLRNVDGVLEFRKEELKGLPEKYIARLKRTPAGGYLVTLDYPDYNPFMENAENEAARRRLCSLFYNRCAGANTKLLRRALRLRKRLASLLGYANYAEYVLKDRMVGSRKTVKHFLEKLARELRPKALAELRMRLELKRKTGRRMCASDAPYYGNLFKKKRYEIDHEKIKEFFPLGTVLDGMLDIFSGLLGVRFVRENLPVWHRDVKVYSVRELDGSLAGYFYADLFPREGKYKHVICSCLRSGRTLDSGAYEVPAAAILANFTSPTSRAQSLLNFNEVQTLFHEFGHVLQIIFSRTRYSRLSSVNAAWDFVEVPSTTLQQWAYEPTVLKRISRHFRSGKRLPGGLIRKMLAARKADSGLAYSRVVALSMIDMSYHTATGSFDTTKIYDRIMERISLIKMPEGTRPEAGFGHLMGGYAAGYYSYVWAEALAADVFGVFKARGINNPVIGRKYRKILLEPGASLDETKQVERFIGRRVSTRNFLNNIGVR